MWVIRHGARSVLVLVALFVVTDSIPLDPADPVPVPPSPQRSGDVARGLRYVLTGDYVRSGPPLEFLMSSSPRKYEAIDREGDNARLPYFLTATTAPNGARIATPNCLQCHADRLNGRLIVGLGDATRDYTVNFALGTKIVDREIIAKFGRKSPQRKAFQELRDVMLVVGPQIRTHFSGVNPADKLAFVLAAHRDAETLEWSDEPRISLPEAEYAMATDVPALWLTRKKNALFYTGLGRGDFARLMMAASLLTLNGLDQVREIEADFVDVQAWVESLSPPQWEGAIDDELAQKGEALFNERCSTCHGRYGPESSYPNLLVSVEMVRTDPLLANSQFTDYPAAIGAFNRSWFAKGPNPAMLVPERGYIAPPLDGIWATAPYFHNGSVPRLKQVLDSGSRPTYWKRRRNAPNYDLEEVGLRYKSRKWAAGEHVYDTTIPGYGNQGHTFGDSLGETERAAVIEYLKRL